MISLRNLQKILILLISVALFSCEGDRISNLHSIETELTSNPQSALTKLWKIEDFKNYSTEEKAYYNLLLSRAMIQNGIEQESDSIINTAIDYFGPEINDINRAWTFYCQGLVFINTHRYSEAVISFLNAESTASEFDDHILSGMIYRGLGDSYKAINDFRSALFYYEKSLAEFALSDKTDLINNATFDHAEALFLTCDSKGAIKEASELLNRIGDDNYKELRAECLRLLAEANYDSYNYNSSLAYYDSLSANYKKFLTDRDLMFKGMAYFHTGDLANAEKMQSCIAGDSDIQLKLLLADKAGEYQIVNKLLQKNIAIQDSFYTDMIVNNVSIPIMSHYKNIVENRELEYRNSRQRYITLAVIILSLLIISLIYIYHHRKLYYKERENNMLVINELRSRINFKDNQLDNASNDGNVMMTEIHRLLADQFNMINHLCGIYFQYKGGNEKAKIYNEVMAIFRQIGESGKLFSDIESKINKYRANILTRLKEEIPNLKEREYQLFVFIALGFSAQTISILQDISVDNVYVRKSSLKKKISKSTAKSKDDLLEVFNTSPSKIY